MLDLAGGDVDAFTGEIVGKAADSGDDLAKKILTEACRDAGSLVEQHRRPA